MNYLAGFVDDTQRRPKRMIAAFLQLADNAMAVLPSGGVVIR
jgi:hypothetical protein